MLWDKEKILIALKEKEKLLGRRVVKRDAPNLYFLSRKYFGTWNNMLEEAGYMIKRFQEVSIPDLNFSLFYYFLGLLITDGHLVKDFNGGRYRIMLFTSYNEERELIIKLIRELFKYNPSIRVKKYGFNKKDNYEIMINSKKLCSLLVDKIRIPSGSKSLNVEVPKFIKEGSKKQIFCFIRGVFDGDGSIIKTEKATAFKIVSGSKNFIFQLKNLLTNYGFNHICINNERKTLWILRINRKEDIKRLYFMLYGGSKGWYYPRKEETWKQYI